MTSFRFSQLFALGTGCAALVQPIAGRLLDRYGVRLCISSGCVALGLGMLALSHAQGPVSLFFAVTIVRGTSIGCLEAWPAAAIALWFRKYRGRAMALFQIVAGFPTGVVATMMQRLDLAFGWRMAMVMIAAGLFCLAAACAALLRDPPSDPAGIVVYPSPPNDCHDAAEHQIECVSPAPPSHEASEISCTDSGQASEMGIVPADDNAAKELNMSAERGPIASAADVTPASRRLYTLGVLYSSVCLVTMIGGGIDIFTIELACGGGGGGNGDTLVNATDRGIGGTSDAVLMPEYDVASFIFLPMGLTLSVIHANTPNATH